MRPRAAIDRVVLTLGLVTWTAIALSIDNGHVGVFHDDGIYLVSARALRDGRGYQLPSRPGNPPPKYPIGFPLAIAAVLRSLPGAPTLARDVAAARAVVIGSGLLFLVSADRWLRRLRVPGPVATGIVLATAFHPSCLVGCASAIFSDLTFCALTYLTFLAMMKPASGNPRIRLAPAFSMGILSGMGVLVRSNGITLVLAALASSLRARRPRWAGLVGVLLGSAIVLGAAGLLPVSSNRPVPSGDYRLEMEAAWSSPGAGLAILGRNLSAVVLDFPARVLLPMAVYLSPVLRLLEAHPAAGFGLRLGCTTVVVIGFIHLARTRTRGVLGAWVHAVATLGLFLIWPWTMILDRFLLGLFPLVFLAAWAGFLQITRLAGGMRGTRSRVSSRLGLALVILLAIGAIAVSARAVQGFRAAGRQWPGASDRRSLAAALRLIEAHLEPDAVVAARWPDTVFLYTGRQAVPLTEDDAILLGRFDRGDRLLRWMELVPGRAFHLLVRGQAEDASLEDRRQAEALGRIEGVTLEPLVKTEDGRYEIIRAIRK
jgi:hypothetical protein